MVAKEDKTDTRPPLTPLIVLALTVVFLLAYFAKEEYETSFKNIKYQFESESDHLENSFINILEQTEFVMKMIISQIAKQHREQTHVDNVIEKYSVNKKFSNVLSWKHFQWFTTPIQTNKNYSDLLTQAKNEPGILHLGKTELDSSKKYILPAAVGAIENGELIGIILVEFDVALLKETLRESIRNRFINFELRDENLNTIIQSFEPSEYRKIEEAQNFLQSKVKDFDHLDTVYDLDFFERNSQHFIRRVPNYPFAIYLLSEDKKEILSFWKGVFYRIIEVSLLAIISFLIILNIHKREQYLRHRAEISRKEAIAASKAKTEFLAYTAHELRSPLGYIVNSSNIIIKAMFGPINQKYSEYINNIHTTAKELIDFINELLDEMRIAEKSFQITAERLDIRDLLKKSIKLNLVNFNNKLNIELKIPKDLPILMSDSKRLSQIFNNIISNAFKYSPENSVLAITVAYVNNEILFTFKDYGPGMSEEELKLATAKYGTVTNNADSVGLGLPLIIELTRALGAKIKIHSKTGEGTTISLIFPPDKIRAGDIDNE